MAPVRLGQHFLRDDRVLRDVVAAARLAPGQRVLEVGPGPGNLTALLASGVGPSGNVTAIEADRALARALEGRWPNVQALHADAVKTDLAALGRPFRPSQAGASASLRPEVEASGRFDRIVANLPYQISGPITIAFLALLRPPATRWNRAVLMYQKEFAERLLSGVGDDGYGRLSVQAARWVRVERVRDVAPGAFDPPPKVESTVLALEPHAKPPFAVESEKLWEAVLATFEHRRKKLSNTLPAAVAGLGISEGQADAALETLGAAGKRPEELAPAEFGRLTTLLGSA